MPENILESIDTALPWSSKKIQGDVAPVTSVDAEAFSRLLAGKDKQVSAPEASANLSSVLPTGAGNTLGDTILRSLQGAGAEISTAWKDASNVTGANDGDLSMTQALQVQWKMVTVSAQYEAIGKAIGKSAQDVDQLVRTQ
ncbi:MAG: EscI/YscI/HrpB family type III secretion system inner rod protein [Pseudomonadota bacterium]